MSSSTAAVDNQGLRRQNHIASDDHNALSLGLQIESLRVLALDLMNVVVKMEECRSRSLSQPIRLSEEVQRFERSLIENALRLTGGHQTKTAKLLGVKLTTLHSKIKKYRITAGRLVLVGAGHGGEAEPARM
jgi:DNA-binding NtrC family response regulator